MSALPALTSQLKTLKLGHMLDTLDVRLLQVRQDQLGFLEFLRQLLQDEIEWRKSQSLRLRLQRASFEEPKTLEDFDFAGNPALIPAAIRDLATGLFIERREHVLLYGPAGTGKTHLAQALGHHRLPLGPLGACKTTSWSWRALSRSGAAGFEPAAPLPSVKVSLEQPKSY